MNFRDTSAGIAAGMVTLGGFAPIGFRPARLPAPYV
jgi:hypothetical protein